MANPSTYPSDGRITSLQNYTANLAGTELLQLVAPGNATAGVNYNITVTQMLSGVFSVLPSQPANVVLAGPTSGAGTATPAFRALVLMDIPGGTSGFPLVGNNATSAPSYQLLTVPGGGIGTAALPAFGVALGNGSSPISVVSPGAAGLALISNNATSAPTFQALNVASAITGVTPIFNGGTGTTTLPLNGVVLGNATALTVASAATGQVLASNAGIPAFTGAPVLATSVQAPLVIGGANATATLTLESTSGTGTGDSIILKTGNQTVAGGINTNQQWIIGVNQSAATNVLFTINKNVATPAAAVVPTALMQIVGADGVQPAMYFDSFGTADQAFFITRHAPGTGGGFSATLANEKLGYFGMVGAAAANTFIAGNGTQGGCFFGAQATENWNATSQGTLLQFFTTPTGTHTATLGITVQASGGLSVGATTDPGTGGILASGAEQILSNVALANGGTTGNGYKLFSVTNLGIFAGTGAPTLSAATSSLYLRNDATSSTTRVYVNTTGATTWVGLTATA